MHNVFLHDAFVNICSGLFYLLHFAGEADDVLILMTRSRRLGPWSPWLSESVLVMIKNAAFGLLWINHITNGPECSEGSDYLFFFLFIEHWIIENEFNHSYLLIYLSCCCLFSFRL